MMQRPSYIFYNLFKSRYSFEYSVEMTGNGVLWRHMLSGGHVLGILTWWHIWSKCLLSFLSLCDRGSLFVVVALFILWGGYSLKDLHFARMGHNNSISSEVSAGCAWRATCVDIAFISLFSCRVFIYLFIPYIYVYLISNAWEVVLRW